MTTLRVILQDPGLREKWVQTSGAGQSRFFAVFAPLPVMPDLIRHPGPLKEREERLIADCCHDAIIDTNI